MKHHYRETSIGKKQATHSKNQSSINFSISSPTDQFKSNKKHAHFDETLSLRPQRSSTRKN